MREAQGSPLDYRDLCTTFLTGGAEKKTAVEPCGWLRDSGLPGEFGLGASCPVALAHIEEVH